MKSEILDYSGICEMFDELNVSIAVIDVNMTMIYMNKAAAKFYEKVFQATDLLGKNVEFCHEIKHVKKIKELMQAFINKEKTISFFGVSGVPSEIIEGGHLKVVHIPYFRNNEFIGIMEVPFESSLEPNGRGEYPHAH